MPTPALVPCSDRNISSVAKLGANVQPTWVDYTGNDTFWATVTGKGKLDTLHNRRVGENIIALT